ncbi:MAG: phosphodiester glycosidase family protein [Clostridia bacterium]|nr:phosphodiester glycosidase family protein [Clostridia bacterium]
MKKVFRILGKIGLFLLIFLVVLTGTLFIGGKMICGNTSPAAKQMFITTLLETGQLKFLASLFASSEEIQAVVDGNSMETFSGEIDTSMITVTTSEESGQESSHGTGGVEQKGDDEKEKDIEIVSISGRTFRGTLMIVKDPSRVSLATIYPWREKGVTLDVLVNDNHAVAGINAGLYHSTNNTGGSPYGVVVSNGEIQHNGPKDNEGLVLIGLTEDNILQIIDIAGMNKTNVENLVAEKKIRDACTFQEESSDKNNHFVSLVLNGQPRSLTGTGSGLNPRTAIGQRADGALLLLVTDGRGASGHLGASAADLIDIMLSYGAVNAANLDGGSSSCMYYDGDYLQTSVTFYYSNASWRLPFAFVVK